MEVRERLKEKGRGGVARRRGEVRGETEGAREEGTRRRVRQREDTER